MADSPQVTTLGFLLPLLFLMCSAPWQLVLAQNQKRIDNLPGYVEVDEEKGVEIFYYFVESERNSEQDPLLVWLTGGPGCSSLSGLVFEIGMTNEVSSVVFVDSPVGTGFSYSRTAEGFQASDTLAVRQLQQFLYKWLEAHPKFKSNRLYLSGSSYSGMIIPALTLEIANAKESHGAPLNLKGYLAGNPITNANFDKNSRISFYNGMAIISDELYESVKQSCLGDYLNPTNIHCAKYLDDVVEVTKDINEGYILDPKCELHSPRPDQIQGWTIRMRSYDEDVPLGSSGLPLGCRSSLYLLSEFWANNSTVRDALGVRKGTVVDWHRCKQHSILYTKDIKSAVPYHLAATSKGYPALIYSGDHDVYASYVGTQAWIRSLNFSIVDDWRPWCYGGQVAGFTRRYLNNLTFATVKGAGHTAPEYKPKECLAMLARWLSGAPL